MDANGNLREYRTILNNEARMISDENKPDHTRVCQECFKSDTRHKEEKYTNQ